MEQKNMIMINNIMEGEEGYNVVPVHMQVMKIKQEIEKIKHPYSLSMEQPAEMRRLLLREINRQRSRSPLGLAAV
uniref:uncharacterized protein LOC105351168 n=1 Tax=Fragaria vesca subsp. vesca TaxID=101020 RepID=UPI0005C9FC75|nr:PREDICTED: uncharacterized protein LOC105351168 [Fragaria vesca subsp. vesca]